MENTVAKSTPATYGNFAGLNWSHRPIKMICLFVCLLKRDPGEHHESQFLHLTFKVCFHTCPRRTGSRVMNEGTGAARANMRVGQRTDGSCCLPVWVSAQIFECDVWVIARGGRRGGLHKRIDDSKTSWYLSSADPGICKVLWELIISLNSDVSVITSHCFLFFASLSKMFKPQHLQIGRSYRSASWSRQTKCAWAGRACPLRRRTRPKICPRRIHYRAFRQLQGVVNPIFLELLNVTIIKWSASSEQPLVSRQT